MKHLLALALITIGFAAKTYAGTSDEPSAESLLKSPEFTCISKSSNKIAAKSESFLSASGQPVKLSNVVYFSYELRNKELSLITQQRPGVWTTTIGDFEKGVSVQIKTADSFNIVTMAMFCYLSKKPVIE